MKYIIIVISVLSSLVIGYGLYPLINTSTSDEVKPTVESGAITNLVECITSPETQPVVASVSEPELETDNSNPQEYDGDNGSNVQNLATSQVETVISGSEPDSFEVTELKQWATIYEETLLNLLNEKLPESIKERFTDEVFSESNFLSSPSINQDPIIDYDWAFAMEERLKIVFSQDEYKDGFELFSLTCKQLTCELFGNDKINGTLAKILSALFKDPSLMELVDSSQLTGKSIPGGDANTYFHYFKIGFKSQP